MMAHTAISLQSAARIFEAIGFALFVQRAVEHEKKAEGERYIDGQIDRKIKRQNNSANDR